MHQHHQGVLLLYQSYMPVKIIICFNSLNVCTNGLGVTEVLRDDDDALRYRNVYEFLDMLKY